MLATKLLESFCAPEVAKSWLRSFSMASQCFCNLTYSSRNNDNRCCSFSASVVKIHKCKQTFDELFGETYQSDWILSSWFWRLFCRHNNMTFIYFLSLVTESGRCRQVQDRIFKTILWYWKNITISSLKLMIENNLIKRFDKNDFLYVFWADFSTQFWARFSSALKM